MKIRVTLEVSDDARRCIASNLKNSGGPYVATQAGMATRATCVRWLEGQLRHVGDAYNPAPKIDPLQRDETALAVSQLRALGWPDSRIKSWLLKQAALMEGARLKLWEDPLLTIQPAKTVENPQATA
jgi:hypothetical protein